MYTLDKKERITLRLNERQFSYVKASADILGVSPSEYLRMLVNMIMSADEAIKDKADEKGVVVPSIAENIKEDVRRENELPDSHNQL